MVGNVKNNGIFIACDYSEAWLIICICVYHSMNLFFLLFFLIFQVQTEFPV